MIKDRTSLFIKLAKQDSLKNNLLSIILAKNPNIDISKRETFFDNISRFYSIHKLEERTDLEYENSVESNSIDQWINSDLRIKNVKLKSLRGFPNSVIPFGIDFTNDDGEAISMVILGGNAMGKSSIYDAIEYNYCKRIGEAELRSSDFFEDEDQKFKDFLRNYNNPFTESFCEIQTNSDEKTFGLDRINIPKAVRSKINPNSHFISDFDIYNYGKLDYQNNGKNTFQNLIATNVGLSEFLEIEKQLYTFSVYKRLIESNKFNGLSKEIEVAKKGIENNKKTIGEKEVQIKGLQTNDINPRPENKFSFLSDLINQLKSNSFSFDFDHSNFKIQIELFKKLYSQYTTLSVKSGSLQEIQFLETGLGLLNNELNCPFCNNSKSNKEEISQHVKARISQLSRLNELSRNLNSSANNVEEYFNQLTTRIKALKTKNQQEISFILDKTEFNVLSREASELDKVIGNNISNDFFGDINKIDENLKFHKDKFGYINFVLERNVDFLSTDFVKNIVIINDYHKKRNEIILKIEADIKSKSTITSTEGQIAILNSDINTLKNQIDQFEYVLKLKESEIIKAKDNMDLYNRIRSEVNEYYKIFHTELAKETYQAFEPIKDIVKNVLGEYLYEEERPVDIIIESKVDEVDEETSVVISESMTVYIKERGSNNPPISINKYFNAFHFRQFCTMVGISIAVASRINTGINLPLVLDDVFYASDFENRATIERFVKKLFDLFNKYTEKIPLQLILFTHDQMIFESVIHTLNEIDVVEKKNIRFAKLFSFEDANVLHNYKNLVYRYPTYPPNKLTHKALQIK